MSNLRVHWDIPQLTLNQPGNLWSAEDYVNGEHTCNVYLFNYLFIVGSLKYAVIS